MDIFGRVCLVKKLLIQFYSLIHWSECLWRSLFSFLFSPQFCADKIPFFGPLILLIWDFRQRLLWYFKARMRCVVCTCWRCMLSKIPWCSFLVLHLLASWRPLQGPHMKWSRYFLAEQVRPLFIYMNLLVRLCLFKISIFLDGDFLIASAISMENIFLCLTTSVSLNRKCYSIYPLLLNFFVLYMWLFYILYYFKNYT